LIWKERPAPDRAQAGASGDSEVLARSIPGARLLPAWSGHVFPLEREAETVAALREHFLAH